MNGLEQTFYIMAIVFMSLIFLIAIALVIEVFKIRAKINKIHDNIESKIDSFTSMAGKGAELSSVLVQAKKAYDKAKK